MSCVWVGDRLLETKDDILLETQYYLVWQQPDDIASLRKYLRRVEPQLLIMPYAATRSHVIAKQGARKAIVKIKLIICYFQFDF